MSSNSAKPTHKMCKTPPKGLSYPNKLSPKSIVNVNVNGPVRQQIAELGNYEVLNTNCTMVGSNNLNLDPAKVLGTAYHHLNITQQNAMATTKLCARPPQPKMNIVSSPDPIRKAHSPRGSQMDTLLNKFVNVSQHFAQRGLQPAQFDSPQGPVVSANIFAQSIPQATAVTTRVTSAQSPAGSIHAMSPSAYSNPSPSYPGSAVSPYNVQISSPANSVSSIASSGVAGIKSPIPSPQQAVRPTTPQPAYQQLPVMTSGPNLVQIIHAPGSNAQTNTYQTPVLTRQTLIAPQVNQQSVIKIKPPLNILPKPAPAGQSNVCTQKSITRPATPANQNTSPAPQIVLPNQAILPTGQSGTLLLNQVPLIVQQNTPQGVQLILRPGTPSAGKVTPQNLILQQAPSPQQGTVLIRNQSGTTVQSQPQQQLLRVLTANGMIQQITPTYIVNNQQNQQIQQMQQKVQGVQAPQATLVNAEQLPPPRRKPKKKKKNKEIKLDLANLMKISGIGDDDEFFESDASESAPNECGSRQNIGKQETDQDFPKRIGNIHISAIGGQDPQKTQGPEKIVTQHTQSQVSVQQSLSDINAINQNLAHIGLVGQNPQSPFMNTSTGQSVPVLSQIPQTQDNHNLANFLQALHNFPMLNQSQGPVASQQNMLPPNFQPAQAQPSTFQKVSTNVVMSTVQTSGGVIAHSATENIVKTQGYQINRAQAQNGTPQAIVPGLGHSVPGHFSVPNLQLQNFCNTAGVFVNQSANTILAPNLQGFAGNIAINGALGAAGLVPQSLGLSNGFLHNFLPAPGTTGLMQQAAEVTAGFAGPQSGNLQRTGGFKLAFSEDGRLVLQHDPNLNQDLPSQLLLQSLFGVNIPSGNLVLTSVAQQATPTHTLQTPQTHQHTQPIVQPKTEPKKPPEMVTKTTSIIQNSIPSTKAENTQDTGCGQPTPPQNFSYIVNLTPDQLETLKRNGQLTVNGQTIFMHRPNVKDDKLVQNGRSPPKPVNRPKKRPPEPKTVKNICEPIHRTPEPSPQRVPTPVKPLSDSFSQTSAPTEPKNEKIQSDQNTNTDPQINVEQFLSSLNITPANLGQLISQKLSAELPGGDHKIVNITPGPTAGQIVAKIDIGPEGMQHVMSANAHPVEPVAPPEPLPPPPLVSVVKEEPNVQPSVQQSVQPSVQPSFTGPEPPQLSTFVVGSSGQPEAEGATRPSGTVYQRIQTIQLTPQKQQLLKSVQLQIQALSARLQQKTNDRKPGDEVMKTDSDNEIHTALRLLFAEQQRILASGKVLPTVTGQPLMQCNVDSTGTQTGPPPSTSKIPTSNAQNQKVFYQHGNQIIISPNSWPQNQNSQNASQLALKLKKNSPTQTQPSVAFLPTKPAQPTSISNEKIPTQVPAAPTVDTTSTSSNSQNVPVLSPKKPAKPTYSKAQLIEQQLNTDQNGAISPDITAPFTSKADACKRLVRYHCYNQPVLSQRDLNKADEIFELTARHFIEKFRGMVSKYKYLLLKESMRDVQTSELMMIDRMFLAEEQQSFLRLRQETQAQQIAELELRNAVAVAALSDDETDIKPDTTSLLATENQTSHLVTIKTERDEKPTDFNIKCGLNYFSEDSCEPSNFVGEPVPTPSPKPFEEFTTESTLNTTSYNTTKIIGNFEIEINNKSRPSEPKRARKEDSDVYDEWLCIQRELGYCPADPTSAGQTDPTNCNVTSESSSTSNENVRRSTKRSAGDHGSRLETLKKFRVDKHNSKVKKSGSIIGEVKFEVRIEHKKVFADQQQQPSPKTGKTKQNAGPTDAELVANGLDVRDTSIDEQVQSAIDSILNLQQISSMANSETPPRRPEQTDPQNATSEQASALDEAVKSILS